MAVDVPAPESTDDYATRQASWALRIAQREGLIKGEGEPWMALNAAAAVKLYRNEVYHTIAALFAVSHPWALSTLQAAPIIVQACTGANPIGGAFKDLEALYLARQFAHKVGKGDKLVKILADYHLPLQMRAIDGHSLAPKRWPALFRLRSMNASTLAQAIPAAKSKQNTWLYLCQAYLNHVRQRASVTNFVHHDAAYHWVAKSLAPVVEYNMDITAVADFMIAEGDAFNLKLTWPEAAAAARRWHNDLAKRNNEAEFFKKHGISFDTPIDYAPFPDSLTIGRYTIVALRSGLDLFEEGKAMRHCVGSYSPDVLNGKCRVFSIRRGEKRVATFDIVRPKMPVQRDMETGLPIGIVRMMKVWQPRQIKGPCNARPAKEIIDLVPEWFKQAQGLQGTLPKEIDLDSIRNSIAIQMAAERDVEDDGE